MVVDFAVPAPDWPLAAGADATLREIASGLAGAGLRRVVASHEPKAAATAQILATVLGLPLATRDGLEEHHRLVEQQAASRDAFVANVRRFFEHPAEIVFGTESADAALARFRAAVAAVMDASTGDEAIVSHGTVMTLLIAAGGNGEPLEIWSSLALPDRVVLGWPDLRRLDG